MSVVSGDRDPQTGYFRPGNRLGGQGGNPNAKRMAELKRALIACGTEDDIQKLYKTLMAAALGGDVQAAKLLLDHLVGRPSQSIEVTGIEGDPVKIDMANLTTVILGALSSHPEARYAVAAALRGISQLKNQETSNGPGNGHSDPA
jgi:hypothetical protein